MTNPSPSFLSLPTKKSSIGYFKDGIIVKSPRQILARPPEPDTPKLNHDYEPKANISEVGRVNKELEASRFSLRDAAKRGNIVELKALTATFYAAYLAEGVDANLGGTSKRLRSLARTKAVRFLFSKNIENRQALYYACLCGHKDCAAFLLDTLR